MLLVVLQRHILMQSTNLILALYLFPFFPVAAQFASGNVPDSTRQRHHAPLYGRLVTEEHLPAVHRDIHQVSTDVLTLTILPQV